MQLNSNPEKIKNIFPVGSTNHYNIPIYQRNYSWKLKNVETLFQDIIDNDADYYVGNLLVTPFVDNSNVYDIVDGQQRITTISLYLLGIYYHLLKAQSKENFNTDNFSSKEYIRKYKRALSDIPRRLINEDDNQPLLKLLARDQEVYEDLLEIARNESLTFTPHKHRLMGKRYKEILDLIQDEFFYNDVYEENNIINLIDFHDKVLEMKILMITVEKVSDAFTIFTSFNAKGLPLTLIDLLKSFYLEKAVDKIGEKRSLDKWNKLLDYFKNSNGEANSSIVTQFLQNNYDTYESHKFSSITKSKALDEYHELFKKNGEQYIDHLINQAMIFSSFNNDIGGYNEILGYSDEMINLLEKISKLEATSLYPVIMFTLNEFRLRNINKDEMEQILSFIVNYFVRRNITLKPKASNLRARGLAAVREMQNNKDEEDYLDTIKRNLMPLAADDELFKIALKGSVYEVNRDTTRLILVDIERQFGSYFDQNQTVDNLTDKNDKDRYYWTLEHIMPQTIREGSEWNNMLEGLREDIDKDLYHQEFVHKLGNLTLTGYNTELSNAEFIDKKDYIDRKTKKQVGLRTELYLNNSIPDTGQDETIDTKITWTTHDIQRRNEQLSQDVLSLYPLY